MRRIVKSPSTAQLNPNGQITRQYIYLADLPIAVIDTPAGKPLSKPELPTLNLIGQDAQTIIQSWVTALTGYGRSEQTRYLHTNHLGAPEASLITLRLGALGEVFSSPR